VNRLSRCARRSDGTRRAFGERGQNKDKNKPFSPTRNKDRRFSLLRLSAGETDLEALLRDRWAASHPERVLAHRLDESRRKAARQQTAREVSGVRSGKRFFAVRSSGRMASSPSATISRKMRRVGANVFFFELTCY
jgi:hypothetical protein